MSKCCIVGCENNVWAKSKTHSCEKHEQETLDMLLEESIRYEEELYNDYQDEIMMGIAGGEYRRIL